MTQEKYFNKFYSSLTDEFKRLLLSRVTQVILLLSSFAPFLGILAKGSRTNLLVFLKLPSSTELSTTLLLPTKIGAVFGVAFFCILTLYELDKISRANIGEIIYVVVSPVKHRIFQTLSLCFAGGIATALASLLFMPYFLIKMKGFHYLGLYFISFFGVMFTAIIFSILLSSGIYFITKSVSLSVIAMIFLFLASFSVGVLFCYLYNWVQSPVPGVSKFFGNTQVLTALFWNRLFNFGLSFSVFLLGLLSQRCFQKGFLKSILCNGRKYKFLPISLLIAVSLPVFSFVQEPLFKKVSLMDMVGILTNNDFGPFFNKNLKTVSAAKMEVKIDPKAKLTSAIFKQDLENQTSDWQKLSISLSPGYHINYVNINRKPVKIKFAKKDSVMTRIYDFLEVQLPAKKVSLLEFSFSGSPKDLSFCQTFSSGVSNKYVYHEKTKILPKLLVDKVNDKISGVVCVNSGLTVVSTGQKNKKISENQDGTSKWSFSNDQVDDFCLCAANYGKIQSKAEGLDVEFFYPMEDKENFSTKSEDIKSMFKFFSHQMGPLNPGTKPLKVVITSGASGGSGLNFSNLITQSEDIFILDSAIKNKELRQAETLFVLASSLANLWWQEVNISNQEAANIIRPKHEIKVNQKHSEWNAQALIDFSSYSFIKSRFGKGVAGQLFLNDYNKWIKGAELAERDFYQRNPKYLARMSNLQKWIATIDVKNARNHKLAPLEVYKIEESIGSLNFSKRIKNVYQKYHKHPDKNLTFADFLNEMEVDTKGGTYQCSKSFATN